MFSLQFSPSPDTERERERAVHWRQREYFTIPATYRVIGGFDKRGEALRKGGGGKRVVHDESVFFVLGGGVTSAAPAAIS